MGRGVVAAPQQDGPDDAAATIQKRGRQTQWERCRSRTRAWQSCVPRLQKLPSGSKKTRTNLRLRFRRRKSDKSPQSEGPVAPVAPRADVRENQAPKKDRTTRLGQSGIFRRHRPTFADMARGSTI